MIDRIKKFFGCGAAKKYTAPFRSVISIFAHNFIQKLLSLITAFMLWFFVMESQDPTIEGSYEVPVTISNAPYDFIAGCKEKTIHVKTVAPRSYFVKYDANAFRAYANLDGFGEGQHEITPQIIMPQGFELIKTDPSAVHVIIDSFAERQLVFELITKGNVSPDTAIKTLEKSMEIVTIMGPKTLVEQITRVYGTLTFSNNTESFEAQIPMKAVDANNNQIIGVRVVPSVVTVSVELENGIAKKIVPVVAELNVEDGWEVTKVNVEPAQIEITGAESAISSIVTIKTEPISVQTGQRIFRGKIRLDVPEGITVKENEVTVSAEIVRKTVMRDSSTPSTENSTTSTENQDNAQ
ncbi:MAG: hypothetical protein IKN27_10410 [Selenomonadaceae bacterium]|nr:hypothetical protein [Selenomonadaceae bacterium]